MGFKQIQFVHDDGVTKDVRTLRHYDAPGDDSEWVAVLSAILVDQFGGENVKKLLVDIHLYLTKEID